MLWMVISKEYLSSGVGMEGGSTVSKALER